MLRPPPSNIHLQPSIPRSPNKEKRKCDTDSADLQHDFNGRRTPSSDILPLPISVKKSRGTNGKDSFPTSCSNAPDARASESTTESGVSTETTTPNVLKFKLKKLFGKTKNNEEQETPSAGKPSPEKVSAASRPTRVASQDVELTILEALKSLSPQNATSSTRVGGKVEEPQGASGGKGKADRMEPRNEKTIGKKCQNDENILNKCRTKEDDDASSLDEKLHGKTDSDDGPTQQESHGKNKAYHNPNHQKSPGGTRKGYKVHQEQDHAEKHEVPRNCKGEHRNRKDHGNNVHKEKGLKDQDKGDSMTMVKNCAKEDHNGKHHSEGARFEVTEHLPTIEEQQPEESGLSIVSQAHSKLKLRKIASPASLKFRNTSQTELSPATVPQVASPATPTSNIQSLLSPELVSAFAEIDDWLAREKAALSEDISKEDDAASKTSAQIEEEAEIQAQENFTAMLQRGRQLLGHYSRDRWVEDQPWHMLNAEESDALSLAMQTNADDYGQWRKIMIRTFGKKRSKAELRRDFEFKQRMETWEAQVGSPIVENYPRTPRSRHDSNSTPSVGTPVDSRTPSETILRKLRKNSGASKSEVALGLGIGLSTDSINKDSPSTRADSKPRTSSFGSAYSSFGTPNRTARRIASSPALPKTPPSNLVTPVRFDGPPVMKVKFTETKSGRRVPIKDEAFMRNIKALADLRRGNEAHVVPAMAHPSSCSNPREPAPSTSDVPPVPTIPAWALAMAPPGGSLRTKENMMKEAISKETILETIPKKAPVPCKEATTTAASSSPPTTPPSSHSPLSLDETYLEELAGGRRLSQLSMPATLRGGARGSMEVAPLFSPSAKATIDFSQDYGQDYDQDYDQDDDQDYDQDYDQVSPSLGQVSVSPPQLGELRPISTLLTGPWMSGSSWGVGAISDQDTMEEAIDGPTETRT